MIANLAVERAIALKIIKQTHGKAEAEAEISLGMFCRAAEASVETVRVAISEMQEKGLIKRFEPEYDFPFRMPRYSLARGGYWAYLRAE